MKSAPPNPGAGRRRLRCRRRSVSALTIDAQERLWLALYGGGGWRADLPSLRAQILQRPWSPAADPQR
jgi:hypothetical protein